MQKMNICFFQLFSILWLLNLKDYSQGSTSMLRFSTEVVKQEDGI